MIMGWFRADCGMIVGWLGGDYSMILEYCRSPPLSFFFLSCLSIFTRMLESCIDCPSLAAMDSENWVVGKSKKDTHMSHCKNPGNTKYVWTDIGLWKLMEIVKQNTR